jgi:hypothetical protein
MVSCGADKSIIFRDVNTEDSAGITLSRVNHIVGKTTLYDMELDRCTTIDQISNVVEPVPVPTFEKLRFRFRLLTSSGSDSKSRPLKAQFSKNFLEKILPFYILSFFTRKKLISSIKFIVKCE